MTNISDGETISSRIADMVADFEQSNEPESTEIGRQFTQLQRAMMFNRDMHSCYEGAKAMNRLKNLYKDVLPYDRYRVILPSDDDSYSDYINASFIEDLYGYRRYIAAQGPIDATLSDFLHMIWTFEVTSIICTAIDNEAGRMKFRRYWPDDVEKLEFGFYHITKDHSSDKFHSSNEYEIRPLVITRGETQRRVLLYQFLNWYDHDIPEDESTVFELLLRVYEDRDASNNTPILVHCSAGCGRTGSLIAIDLCRLFLNDKNLCDNKDYQLYPVFHIVLHIRQFRMALIQTLKQYVFVHKMFSFIMKINGNILLRSILNRDDDDETQDVPLTTSLSTPSNISPTLRRQSGPFQITLRDPPIRRRLLNGSNTSSPAMSPSDIFSSSPRNLLIVTPQTPERSSFTSRFSLFISSNQHDHDAFLHTNELSHRAVRDDFQLEDLRRHGTPLLRQTHSDCSDVYSIAFSDKYNQKQYSSNEQEAFSD